MHRLQRIVATVAPDLSPNPCRSSKVAMAEGAAIARWAEVKVALLAQGIALAERSVIENAIKQRGLQFTWCEKPTDAPPDTDILITTGAPVGKEVLNKTKKVNLVAVGYSGYDCVDVEECSKRGIKVVNVPRYATDATADLVFGLIISHLRRLPQCSAAVYDGQWPTPEQEDLQSKIVGIVGTGAIGLRVAELAKAFKVQGILGVDLKPCKEFVDLGGKYTESLAQVFLDADIVVICVPLNNDTNGLVSRNLMELLRPDSLLINVARGAVVDQTALVGLLKNGRFRVALDVEEIDAELLTVPKDFLMMTPHIGFQTPSSLAKRFEVTMKNIYAFLADQPVNVVTEPLLSPMSPKSK